MAGEIDFRALSPGMDYGGFIASLQAGERNKMARATTALETQRLERQAKAEENALAGDEAVANFFESLDGEPVQLFFLLVSPPDRPGDHLRALESISRQLRDDSFCKLLKAAKDPGDIRHLLEEADSHGVVS